jgi:NAD(P)H-dependent FMN reductase
VTRIQVVMGTTRTGRFSERVAPWVPQRLMEYGFDVELLDLRALGAVKEPFGVRARLGPTAKLPDQ